MRGSSLSIASLSAVFSIAGCSDDATIIDSSKVDTTDIVDVTHFDDAEIVEVTDAGSGDASDVDAGPRRCNGHAEFCDRTLAELALPGTHNSMSNAEQRFGAPNQNRSLQHQLEDGIRAMLIDTYIDDGDLLLCHGTCAFGSSDAVEQFAMIRQFLDDHPNEVMIFILEDHIEFDDTRRLLDASGIADLLFTPPLAGEPWPTVGEMIDAGTRVLVTLESGDGDDSSIGAAWDVFFETPYSFEFVEDFTCDPNRGSDNNALFLLNHWLGRPLPLPAYGDEANAYDVLYERATTCTTARGQMPNVVAVDFYDQGDLFEVVDVLNGVAPAR
jgi:hypothetical protein